jgi:hypothetical protein
MGPLNIEQTSNNKSSSTKICPPSQEFHICLFVCLDFYGTSTHNWPYRAECYNRLKTLRKTL